MRMPQHYRGSLGPSGSAQAVISRARQCARQPTTEYHAGRTRLGCAAGLHCHRQPPWPVPLLTWIALLLRHAPSPANSGGRRSQPGTSRMEPPAGRKMIITSFHSCSLRAPCATRAVHTRGGHSPWVGRPQTVCVMPSGSSAPAASLGRVPRLLSGPGVAGLRPRGDQSGLAPLCRATDCSSGL